MRNSLWVVELRSSSGLIHIAPGGINYEEDEILFSVLEEEAQATDAGLEGIQAWALLFAECGQLRRLAADGVARLAGGAEDGGSLGDRYGAQE